MTRDIEVDEAEFRRFVSGQALDLGPVKIRLKPTIGWVRLMRAVLDAIAPPAESVRKRPPDPPQAREFLPLSQQRRRE